MCLTWARTAHIIQYARREQECDRRGREGERERERESCGGGGGGAFAIRGNERPRLQLALRRCWDISHRRRRRRLLHPHRPVSVWLWTRAGQRYVFRLPSPFVPGNYIPVPLNIFPVPWKWLIRLRVDHFPCFFHNNKSTTSSEMARQRSFMKGTKYVFRLAGCVAPPGWRLLLWT